MFSACTQKGWYPCALRLPLRAVYDLGKKMPSPRPIGEAQRARVRRLGRWCCGSATLMNVCPSRSLVSTFLEGPSGIVIGRMLIRDSMTDDG